ncbi:MAG: phosphoribosylformylglycinamidine synthase subunit PurQ [Bdellovibrionota bacterium]
MSLKIGITRFLGTNCDDDVKKWVQSISHHPEYLWFEDQFNIDDYDMVIIPGGFSHGDYLRCGALAAHTPVMKSVKEFANKGKPILGICNGFQILCEAGILPGVLLKNDSLKFKDEWTSLKVNQNKTIFLNKAQKNQIIRLPIAHGEGKYYAESSTLKKLADNEQIWLTYENNPNGAALNIAGITNENKNVCGLMPHPERALFDWMGGTDGMFFL